MPKCEIIKLNRQTNLEQPIFDTYEENDFFGELKDKAVTIKVHRVGTNRILLELPTDIALDREDYFIGLISAAVPLLKKGYKVYKKYVDKKKKKTPKPTAFAYEEGEEKPTIKKVAEAVTAHPQVAEILNEYPMAKQLIEDNPNNVSEYFQEFINESEETGDLDDIMTSMFDDIGNEIIKLVK